MPHARSRFILLLVIVGVFIALGAVIAYALAGGLAPDKPRNAQFVGRQSCVACHSFQHDSWTGSDHDWAMKEPSEHTVLADFNDATFTHFGVTSRFFRKDGKYFVHTEGEGGVMQDFEVKYTFGYWPLQQFLIEFPGGRLQSLTIAWDSVKRRWYHLYPDERITHDDPLHWTRRLQNWNYMCADCHSTNLQKNYDVATDTYKTTWSEINVSCEACHGPASEHVRWAGAGPFSRMFIGGNKGLTTELKTSSAAQLNSCFPCHARRQTLSTDYVHGDDIFDHYLPETLREGLYHADGQILDEVYEFASYTQSKMYHMNIRCTDCHDPHTTKVYIKSNALCVRCHQPEKFDTPAHHHHQPGTEASLCYNCHMPTKTYMGIDVRRDHSLRLPRPDLSVKIGTPNACNQCHNDKTPQWAADAVVQWFGPTRPGLPHYGEIIAAGRARKPEAELELIRMLGDPQRPAVVRATTAQLLREYPSSAVTDALRRALTDPSPIVRQAAAGSFERLAPAERITPLRPLLRDKTRAVRVEAARVMLPARPLLQDAEIAAEFDAALAEYVASQLAVADQPPAHVNLALMHATLGQVEKAEAEYRHALKLDASFVPAKMNLAMLLNGRRENAEAERLLRDVIRQEPRYGEAYYSLGLLLAEMAGDNPAKMSDVAATLLKAAELMPDHPRVQYNTSLALQRAGRDTEAEQRLLRAIQLEPSSRDFLFAAGIFYFQRRDLDRAWAYLERIVRANPADAEARRLMDQIRMAKLRG